MTQDEVCDLIAGCRTFKDAEALGAALRGLKSGAWHRFRRAAAFYLMKLGLTMQDKAHHPIGTVPAWAAFLVGFALVVSGHSPTTAVVGGFAVLLGGTLLWITVAALWHTFRWRLVLVPVAAAFALVVGPLWSIVALAAVIAGLLWGRGTQSQPVGRPSTGRKL